MQTYSHVATAGQTSFPCSYGVGSSSVSVFQNGVLLSGSDINLTSGNAAVLNVAAAASDEITIQVQDVFSVADTVSAANGGTFTGNVSMSGTLGVTGAVTASNGLTVDDAAATPLTVDRSGAVGSIIDVQKDGSTVGAISNVGSDFVVGSSTGSGAGLRFDGSGNQMYASNSLGSARDNAVSLGASTVRFSNLYLGGGAYLGGTGAANKLSSYEEGSWTPVLGGSTSTSGQSYSAQAGTYTKIGNTVNAHAYISLSNAGTVSGTYAYIMGFPFSVTNNSGSYPAFPIGYFAGLGQNVSSLGGYLNINTPTAYVTFRQGAGVNIQYLSAGGIGTASMIFSITYNTAA